MTQITQTVTEKIKKYLNIEEDIDAFALYDIVYLGLINSHPDQFEDSAKKEAEERFKTLNNFLDELKREINFLKLHQKPSELILYERNFEIVKTKNEVLHLQKEINELKEKLTSKDYKIKSLNDEIEKLLSKNFEESEEDLSHLYKPTKSGIMTFSISSILLLFIGIISQFDTLKNKLIEFSPVSPEIINWSLFSILVFTLLNQLVRFNKKTKLKKISDELLSSRTIKDFYNQYVRSDNSEYYPQNYFTEIDIEDYIRNKYCNHRYRKSIAFYIESIFIITDFKSINYLKKYFLNNLLNHKYISIGSSSKMNRMFTVK